MIKMTKRRSLSDKFRDGEWFFVMVTFIVALICFLPLWIAFATSFSSEAAIRSTGFALWPKEFTFATYQFMTLNKGAMVLKAYIITFIVVIVGTVYSLVITTCFAYAAAQKATVFKYANALSFISWFTTVFSGGVLPWYIMTTRYYHLQNNIFALFVPAAMNVFNMMILRNSFKATPEALYESARLDGAGNMCIFWKIALPLNKVSLVTITLFYALGFWNDFHLSLYLVTKHDYYTVQKLLYQMITNISALMSNSSAASENLSAVAGMAQVPIATARMCMTVFATFPVLIFYPFAQKYFVQGITVGAVKG